MFPLRIPQLGQFNRFDIRYWVLLPIMVIFLLLSILAWRHVTFVHQEIPNQASPAKVVLPPITLQSALFKVPLFGDFVTTQTTIEPASFDATVLGVLYNAAPGLSQVIIRIGDDGEKNYQVGDTLVGGAVIREIDETGVVVLYQGKLERLNLPENPLQLSPVDDSPLDEDKM